MINLRLSLVVLFVCCSQIARGHDLTKIQQLHTNNDVDFERIEKALKILSENFLSALKAQESNCSEQ